MTPHPRPNGPHHATSLLTKLARRHGTGGAFLKGWLVEDDEHLKFSFGLTGVDQVGNFIWVDVLLFSFVVFAGTTLFLYLTNTCWRQMRHVTTMGSPERQKYWEENRTRWWPWIQRHILLAPLHKKRHNRGFQLSSAIDNGTLPGRWHTILLVLYMGANIAWCLILPWKEERMSVIAALRGRAGTLSALNLIPTVLFALRNNPLIPLLQVSYDSFNLFHRWAARITILEAIVHTVAWLVNTKDGGGWKAVADGITMESSYSWGMVATIAFTVLGIQAASPFRHAFYETFLNIHRLMAWAAFIGIWFHLHDHGLPQIPWMQLIFILYGTEILFRIVRVAYYSIGRNGLSRITVEAMPGEACRVTIDMARAWVPRPGCHAHIYMPTMSLLSSHPFSIAWSPPMELGSKEMTLPTLEGQVIAQHRLKASKQVSFICRARTGFTRHIYDKAAKMPNQTFTTRGGIEGPYGGHHSLDSYGTVVLFAGGVGITHQVMYIKHLIEGAHRGTTSTQRIVLIWTVPNSECLEWIRPWMDEILRMPGRKQILRILLFISRPKRSLGHQTSETVKMIEGRPNHRQLVEGEMRTRVGAMAVTVCAAGGFADEVRAAVRPCVTEGSVDFIEEAFTY